MSSMLSVVWVALALCLPTNAHGINDSQFSGGASGSMSYYQQSLASGSKAGIIQGNTGVMTYSVDMGEVQAVYTSAGGGRWTVGATSQITRSTRWGVPKWDDNDIFLLDGQELVCESGCSTIGGTRVYHQKNQSYMKIEYIDVGSDSSHWKIQGKDGTIHTYGGTPDSRIAGLGKPNEHPRVWAINRTTDYSENTIKNYKYITFDGSDGAFYLDRIVVGVNGASQYVTTEINYEIMYSGGAREDYRSGSRVLITHRPDIVRTYVGTDSNGGFTIYMVKRFVIDWIHNSSMIRKIVESGQTDQNTLGSIKFKYQSDTPGYTPKFSTEDLYLSSRSEIRTSVGDEVQSAVTKMFIDYNNDGYMDSMFVNKVADTEPPRAIEMKAGTAAGLNGTYGLVGGVAFGDASLSSTNIVNDTIYLTSSGFIDIDGNGQPDLVGTEKQLSLISGRTINNGDSNDNDIFVCYNHSNDIGGSLCNSFAELRNFDDSYSPYISRTHKDENVFKGISDLIDVNGDGIPDLVSLAGYAATNGGHLTSFSKNDLVVRLGTGRGFISDDEVFLFENASENGGVGVRTTLKLSSLGELEDEGTMVVDQTIADLLDVNGDGLLDRIWEDGTSIEQPRNTNRKVVYYPGTGNGFDRNHKGLLSEVSNNWNRAAMRTVYYNKFDPPLRFTESEFIDVNGDNLVDLMQRTSNGYNILLNTGYRLYENPLIDDTFSYSVNGSAPRVVNGSETVNDFLDYDGDGVLDLWSVKDGQLTINRGLNGTDLLVEITNHLGGKTNYSYSPVDKGPGSRNENYPSKQWLVSTVTSDNGFGQIESTHYDYSGGVYDRLHREDRGFKNVEITYHDRSKTKTEYYVDNTFAGRIKKRIEYSQTSHILNYQLYEYQNFCSEGSDHYGCGTVQSYPNSLFENSQVTVRAIANTAIHSFSVDGSTHEDIGMMPGGTNWLRFKEIYTYDNYGNIITYANNGIVDSSGYDQGNDATETTWTYTNDIGNWLFLPASEVSKAFDMDGNFVESGKIEWVYEDSNVIDSWNEQKVYKSVLDEDPAIHKRVFNSDGNLESETDPVGIKTRYEYNHASKRFRTREVLSPPKSGSDIELAISYNFDPYWRIASETDQNGQITTYEYDEFSRLTRVIAPTIGDVSYHREYSYDDYQGPSSPNSVVESYGTVFKTIQFFDGFGETIQTKVLENDGKFSTTNYYQKYIVGEGVDGFWEGLAKNSPLTNSEAFDKELYDIQGNLSYSRGSLWTRYLSSAGAGRLAITYEPNGRNSVLLISKFKKTEINPGGHTTLTESLPEEQTTRVTRTQFGSPLSTTSIKQAFDGVELTDDDGNITTIAYNWLGYKTYLNDLSIGNWNYTYDNAGKMLTQLDAKGTTITYKYDCLGRLITKTYPDDSKIEWYYDGDDNRDGAIDRTAGFLKGRLSKVVDSSGTVLFGYDAHGNKVWESKTIDGITKTTTWIYDMLGRVIEMRYPDDTQPVKFHHAPSGGGLVRIEDTNLEKDILSSASTNRFGDLTEVTFGNGTSSQFEYSNGFENFRLKKINHKFVGLERDFNYEHDALGNVTSINSSSEPSYNRSYAYDGMSRLLEVSGAGSDIPSESFTYSGTSNLLTKSIKDESFTFEYGVDQRPYQVTRTTNSQTQEQKSFGYDANGNMLMRNKQTITYNYDNMPIKVQDGASESIYTYDFSGNRVKAQTGSRVAFYFNPYYETRTTAQGSESIKHYYIGGTRVATHAYKGSTQSEGETLWYHSDHLGSTASVSNSEGQLVFEAAYTAFGETAVAKLHNGESDEPVYKYTGKELDGTGLYYYESRFYDPTLGKFIQPDPIFDKGPVVGMNRYAYAMNNPLAFSDPDGHFACGGLCIIAIGAVTGFVVESVFALSNDGSISNDEWKSIGIGTAVGALGGALSGGTSALLNSAAKAAGKTLATSIFRGSFTASAKHLAFNTTKSAVIGAISNSTYQGLSMAAGLQKDGFSVAKLGTSVGVGAAFSALGSVVDGLLENASRNINRVATNRAIATLSKTSFGKEMANRARAIGTDTGLHRNFMKYAQRGTWGRLMNTRNIKFINSRLNVANAWKTESYQVKDLAVRYGYGSLHRDSLIYRQTDSILKDATHYGIMINLKGIAF